MKMDDNYFQNGSSESSSEMNIFVLRIQYLYFTHIQYVLKVKLKFAN